MDKYDFKGGAIFAGPNWRLQMILQHPALLLAERFHQSIKNIQRIWTSEEIKNHEDPSHTDADPNEKTAPDDFDSGRDFRNSGGIII